MRRLARWPYLASVAPPRVTEDGAGVHVVFAIRERLLVGALRFEGNEVFTSRDLILASGVRTGDPYTPGLLGDAEEAVLARYHQDGFLVASVEGKAEPRGAGRADILFQVTEGRRVHVRDVRLRGARAVSESEALSALSLKPRRFFGVIARGNYIPKTMAEDLERLRAFYRSRGFLAAEVSFGGLELDRSLKSATVTLDVIEGEVWRLIEARVEGAKLFPRALLEREIGIGLRAGAPYSGEAVQASYLRLLRWYEERSDIVPRIQVRTEFEGTNAVSVIYEVDESRRHVENGLVEIRGNRITRDRVVRQDVALVPGRHFTRAELARTREALQARGFYESVEIDTRRGSDPERPGVEVRDVEITVKEKERMGMLYYGGGVSTGAGGYGYFKLEQPNFDLFRLPRAWDDWAGAFQGGGQLIEVEAVPGSRESFYRLRFAEPYLFRSDLALFLAGGTSLFDRRTYDESRLGGTLEVRKYFDPERRSSASLGWGVDLVEIDDLDPDAPPDAISAEGRTLLSHPRAEVRYDGRVENYFSGSTGLLLSLRADIAGEPTGSEVDFARVAATAGLGVGLVDARPDYRHVLQLGVSGGWMDGLGGGEVPLFERFYLGGPGTFRGFGYRRLGPHQGRSPVGGEALLHGTVQYSLPLFWREIRALALFDWGDLEPGISDVSTGRFRTAAGGGLMLRLTILGMPLPANFYWVKALSSEAGDREDVFSFTIGLGF